MFKKFLSLTLALVMALGLVAGAVDYKDADDISDYAEKAVETVHDLNIMQGDNHGNFNPKEPITREQMFRVMYAVHNAGDINISSLYEALLTSSYKDADQVATWARAFAGYNVSKQIFKGDGAGMLRPKASISYQEVAVLFLRALGYKDDYITGYNPLFNWGQNALLLAHEAGITKGLPSISNPAAAATREDVAVMAANAIKAVTVRFDKDANVYIPVTTGEGIVTLGDAKYGVTGAVQGLVTAYTKDTYTVATSVDDENKPAVEKTYKLASGETLDPSLVGTFVRWTFRNGKDADRINNLAKVDDNKLFDNVNLADIKWDGKKLNVGSEKIDLEKVDANNILFFSAGNGVNAINYKASVLDTLKAKNTIAEPYKVSVSYNKIKVKVGEEDVEKHIIGLLGLYDSTYTVSETSRNVFGLAQITKIDGVVVKLKFVDDDSEYFAIANDLTGLAKDDIVYVTADFADMILKKNNDKDLRKKAGDADENTVFNVDLVRVAPVQVAAPKFSTKTVGNKTTYYIDGKEVTQAVGAVKDWNLGTSDPFAAYDKDMTYNVYAIDNFVYWIVPVTGEVTTAKYFYGLLLDEYFTSGTNGAAFVKVLAADGSERELEVAAMGKFDNDKVVTEAPKRTKAPVSFDAAGFPVFGIQQFYDIQDFERTDGVVPPIPVSYTAVGDKFIVVPDVVANSNELIAELNEDTLTKGSTASTRTLTIEGTTEKDKVLYTKDTIFFVRYKDNDELKTIVLSMDGIKATQKDINGAVAYKKLSDADNATKVATVAFLNLPDNVTLIEAAEAKGDSIILTAAPVVNFVNGEYTVTFNGFVGSKHVEATYDASAAGVDSVTSLKALDQITLKLKDNVFVGLIGDKEPLDKYDIVEYVDGAGFITLKKGEDGAKTYDFDEKVNVFYLDKDGKVVDAYTVKAGDHNAYIVTKTVEIDEDDTTFITTIIFKAK